MYYYERRKNFEVANIFTINFCRKDFCKEGKILYRIKQNSANHGTYSAFIKTSNHRLYHYANNNPVIYKDPNGDWVVNIGGFGFAGAGVGGSASAGFSIGYSKEKGVTLGVFLSESIGTEFGADASVGVFVSLDVFSKGIESGITQTMTIGGSADVGIAIGGDFTLDLDTKEMDVSIGASKSKTTGGNTGAGVKIGLGVSAVAAEGHVRYNATQTKATSLNAITTAIDDKLILLGNQLDSIEKSMRDYIWGKILEGRRR